MTVSTADRQLISAEAGPPSPASQKRRGWRVLAVTSIGLLLMAVAVLAVARRVPDFYRERTSALGAPTPAVEQAARRLVSDVSALHAAFIREGAWEAAFTEDDINAWLAVDLPRNHRRLLPDILSEPRVRLSPRQVQGGVRIGRGVFSLVAVVAAEVELRDPNQLGITVVEARIGSLRLPYGLILGEIRQRFDRLGMVTSIRRLDGRSVLVVYIPSTHESGGMTHWLESLAITDGGLAVAGHTRPGRPPLMATSSSP